ncbi:site-specific tyrosine recombinase XerD [Aeromicrobium wangtongii]|uniref:Tyrosine recombinase XerD n=1 Tax=Aeromicrobium wangtongii TaxID=2969247 RepID=A0ABY5M6J8_9ACTN|nr:site-specific tyrosine recombinase XerD [Aeromicrobium wangtongii]MCD9198672.1 site-specific tyrosine recombinase XerD [Aeromicrobium wangtongii]MCL3818647.1 site-specific tyrosine recombinase XerD [Aeromicrobium wangtongii]UUP12696.1 site-specific tyrosine recombinase XerD [Aeromicrobium wangtongii]
MSEDVGRGVQDYLSHLTVERGLADNTLRSYRRDLRRYLDFLATREITDPAAITENDITAFLGSLRTGDADHVALGTASAARTIVAVRGLHRFWLREQTVPTDVTAAVKPPRPASRLPKALPLSDVEAILDAAGSPGTILASRDRALLELLYGTGARISEAVGLDIDDLDLEESTVLLRGKGGKQRIVPLGSYAKASLADYLTASRPALVSATTRTPGVFLNARGGRLSRQSAWTVLTKAADRAGIGTDVSPHTLRHSFATHLLDGGADVRVVQELLGHASVTTTQIYTLVTVEKLREIYATAHPRAARD